MCVPGSAPGLQFGAARVCRQICMVAIGHDGLTLNDKIGAADGQYRGSPTEVECRFRQAGRLAMSQGVEQSRRRSCAAYRRERKEVSWNPTQPIRE
jgi:hypothetical protein